MRILREEIDPQGSDGKRAEIRLTAGWRAIVLGGNGRPSLRRRIHTAVSRFIGGAASGEVSVFTIFQRSYRRDPLSPDVVQRINVEPRGAGARPATWRPTVWFNPWMYQNGEQIWAGLNHEVITSLTGRMNPVEREHFWLALNLRRLDRPAIRQAIYRALIDRLIPFLLWLALSVLVGLASLLFGVARVLAPFLGFGTILATIWAIYRSFSFLSRRVSDTFPSLVQAPSAGPIGPTLGAAIKIRDPQYEARSGFLYLVQTDIRSVLDLVADQERPLVVFVDDVDRCSSSAVAQVIEAINLFLAGEFPNCIFVIALDPEVVAAHIEVAYHDIVEKLQLSPNSDHVALGWRFLDKIVQLPLRIPAEPSRKGLEAYLDSLLRRTGRLADSMTGKLEASLPSEAAPRLVAPEGSETSTRPSTSPVIETVGTSPQPPMSGEDLVKRLASLIRVRGAEVANINDIAGRVQAEVFGTALGGPLRLETRAAARQVLSEQFRDDNPQIRETILNIVTQLPSKNPREIKRAINLFRFYAFIGAERQFAGLAAPDLKQAAKLATLAVRWPELMGRLAAQADDGRIWLDHLEDAARSTPTKPVNVRVHRVAVNSGKAGRRAPAKSVAATAVRNVWISELGKAGLSAEGERLSINDLRGFLETEVDIGCRRWMRGAPIAALANIDRWPAGVG